MGQHRYRTGVQCHTPHHVGIPACAEQDIIIKNTAGRGLAGLPPNQVAVMLTHPGDGSGHEMSSCFHRAPWGAPGFVHFEFFSHIPALSIWGPASIGQILHRFTMHRVLHFAKNELLKADVMRMHTMGQRQQQPRAPAPPCTAYNAETPSLLLHGGGRLCMLAAGRFRHGRSRHWLL